METKAVAIAHWEDLVFEKRNKMYGAYQLRRKYSKRLILGLGISVAVFIVLLGSSRLTVQPVAPIPIPDDRGTVYEPLQPPVIKRPPPAPKRPSPPVTNAALPPLVVTEPVVDTPVLPVDAFTPDIESGTDDGTQASNNNAIGVVTSEPVAVEPPPTLLVAQKMPEYPGGVEAMMRYIISKIKYPRSAERTQSEGTVYVQFVVTFDGSIQQVEVVRGFHPDCDKEAVRVISTMPKWMAGSQNGKPVNVRMILPIKFAITR